jgi:hypothetical protein
MVDSGTPRARHRARTTYTHDELTRMLLDGVAPLHCRACGCELGEAEPDIDGVEDPCAECGAPGDQVASALVIAQVV